MSTDAEYIFDYYCNDYVSPTPMEKDIKYLKERHGGEFIELSCSIIYWQKPKNRLLKEEIDNLCADRVLEKIQCELFEIVI